jgi:hypothetical protein
MQVAARGGHRGVPKGLLHQVDGRAPVETVARMSMAQPVRGDLGRIGARRAHVLSGLPCADFDLARSAPDGAWTDIKAVTT